jgi:NhaC family Na+:H+ antiporter
VLLIVAGVLLGIEVYLFLGAALLFAAICTRWRGESWQRIGEAVGRGLSRSRNVVLILALISILIGLWKQNGTLATLIYYGFGFIRPEIYLVMVFILSSMVSMLLGTAIGTASTVGIVLMGLAESMGMSAGMVAGAVVGGAYVGDRSAPTSGPLHLVATATGTRSGELIPYLFSTLIPAYLLSVGFYYLLGLWVRPEAVDPGTINHFQELLAGHFTVALYLLLPPLLLLSLAVFRVEIIPNLLLTLAATLICSLLGPFSPGDILHSAIWGYIPAADLPFAAVLSGGGFLSFRNILLVIMVAMSLTALLEATGVIHQAMSRGFASYRDRSPADPGHQPLQHSGCCRGLHPDGGHRCPGGGVSICLPAPGGGQPGPGPDHCRHGSGGFGDYSLEYCRLVPGPGPGGTCAGVDPLCRLLLAQPPGNQLLRPAGLG